MFYNLYSYNNLPFVFFPSIGGGEGGWMTEGEEEVATHVEHHLQRPVTVLVVLS